MDDSNDTKTNFFKHVFSFDNDSKVEILNIIQYALLAIIPIIILNKSMSKYIPDADEQKGSLEISAEVILQILIMFIGLMLVHRIITYFPTYSGEKYPDFSITYIILSVLLITLSLQTKLGEKVSILFERLVELWEGKSENKGKNNKKNSSQNANSTQQISMPAITQSAALNTQQMYNDGTSINSLPINSSSTSQQALPNYNNMFRQDTTPLVDAASPGQTEGFYEPMAANSVLGGGFGSAW